MAEFQAASQADPAADEPDVDAGAATQQASKHPVEEAPYKANKKRPKKKVTAVKSDDEVIGECFWRRVQSS